MRLSKTAIVSFLLLISCVKTQDGEQFKIKIDELNQKRQDRLDTGNDMIGTENNYYSGLDSLRNVIQDYKMEHGDEMLKQKVQKNELLLQSSLVQLMEKQSIEIQEEIELHGIHTEITRLEHQKDKILLLRKHIDLLLEY